MFLEAERRSAGRVRRVRDPREAVSGADVVYTDAWTSMGHEKESALRRVAFAGYTVDAGLLARAQPDCAFMHCLPAHRGEEVTDEVIDGPQSRVWDEAENRWYTEQALLYMLITGNERWEKMG